MAAKSKLSLIILILSVLVLYSGLDVAKQDSELKECMHQCRVQQKYDEEQKEECARKCEDYHIKKKGRESEEKHEDKREGEEEEEQEQEKHNPYVNLKLNISPLKSRQSKEELIFSPNSVKSQSFFVALRITEWPFLLPIRTRLLSQIISMLTLSLLLLKVNSFFELRTWNNHIDP
ncbi:hypothetical protein DITRI_Ditri11bG0090200 [Diplodiscus trichospermus]